MNLIGGVMVSVLASSLVDQGYELGRVKPKTIKVVYAASPLYHAVLRNKSIQTIF